MKLVNKTRLVGSPGKGVVVHANSFYTRAQGLEKMQVVTTMTRSDTTDTLQRRFSADNGRTWSEPEAPVFISKTAVGVRRLSWRTPFVDPSRDLFLELGIDGTLPNDSPLEGMKQWFIRYRVSVDGGRTFIHDRQAVQTGYTPDHPFDGVTIGKSSMMIGDLTCRPILARGGRILVPVQITPVGPDGVYINPGKGYTFHDAAVLIGVWQDDRTVDWTLSSRVRIGPECSTRGAVEPTIAELDDGRLLMICRGSNDANPGLPGRKWRSVSEDGGRTWMSPPAPWAYDDGEVFFSPSACSQLLKHSNGGLYWFGNITPVNPEGNRPRYPLVGGRVDPQSLGLIRSSVIAIDDKGATDDPWLTLSNFMAHEDRETHELVVHMSRFGERGAKDWTSDAYEYRIAP